MSAWFHGDRLRTSSSYLHNTWCTVSDGQVCGMHSRRDYRFTAVAQQMTKLGNSGRREGGRVVASCQWCAFAVGCSGCLGAKTICSACLACRVFNRACVAGVAYKMHRGECVEGSMNSCSWKDVGCLGDGGAMVGCVSGRWCCAAVKIMYVVK